MRPPRHKLAVLNWIAIYPIITLALWSLRPVIGDLPLAVQTLILSLLLVSLMQVVVMPLLLRAFRGWLAPRRGAGGPSA
ncbi:hypothetical protein ACVU7I_05970 [Patulibacter sp. S7RM1-6]